MILAFSDAGDLTVGSVDGLIGIQNAGGTVTLRADNLEIAQVINSGARTTLLPFYFRANN